MTVNSFWDTPDKIDMVYADTFRPVNQQAVSTIMHHLVDPGARVLEVGSGLGHLASLIPPEYLSNYVQTDATPLYVEQSAANNPRVKAQVADVYDLPFGNTGGDTFDAVVAMDFIDVLEDLPAAVQQIGKVLASGGRFIHFHNRRPSMGTLSQMQDFASRLVFPFVDKDNGLRRFQLVRPEAYEAARTKLAHPEVSHAVATHPQLLDHLWVRDRALFEAVGRDIAAKLGHESDLTEEFSVLMHVLARRAFEGAGLEVDYAGTVKSEKQLTRKQAAHFLDPIAVPPGVKDRRYWNVFQKEASGPTVIDHEILPNGQIMLRNQLSLFIAHKEAA